MSGKLRRILTLALAILCALVLLQPVAMADVPVGMTLTGVHNGIVVGSVYVDPYSATIGTQPDALVICDDFAAETWVWESWTAHQSTVANLSGNKFTTSQTGYSIQQNYNAAAWLAEQLMSNGNLDKQQTAGDYSYAIWSIFDPAAADGQPNKTAILDMRNDALGRNYAGIDFSNVNVYTPVGNVVGCGGPTDCSGINSPQEFLVVNPVGQNLYTQTVPEGSAIAFLFFDLLALSGGILVLRRRFLSH